MRKLICIILVIVYFISNLSVYAENRINEIQLEEVFQFSNVSEPILNATNAILYDKTYQSILYEKKSYERVPNASTTKMLTAIVAYENADMDDVVTVSKNAANITGSVIGLRSGDKISLRDLLRGLLVRSGNDAAIAIADYIGGNVEQFAILLNQKIKELEIQNTCFITPHGLDAEGHYSSAYDLVKIAEYLLNIEELANIVKQKTAVIQINGQSRTLTTTNEMLSLYEGTNGVKTGYTANAGRCLVTSCTREGRTLIAVVLGCGTKGQRTSDTKQLLNYGFQEFEVIDICEKMKKEFTILVNKANSPQYQITIEKRIVMPIKKSDIDDISYQYHMKTKFEAPIPSNTIIGHVTILVKEKEVGKVSIILLNEIPRKGFKEYLKELILNYRFNYEIPFK